MKHKVTSSYISLVKSQTWFCVIIKGQIINAVINEKQTTKQKTDSFDYSP